MDLVQFLNMHPVTNLDPVTNPKLEKDPEKDSETNLAL
jgi:hypothetical protein